jgi:flagellar M-ring protein FliF
MAAFLARVEPVRERWSRLSLGARVAIMALCVMAGGAWAFTAFESAHPARAVLFSNLADEDAARIIERLRATNTPYELSAAGTTILVPENQVHETRLMLAGEGLPNGGGVGFEVFDAQRFGESEFAEQVKYHRALEGELARTISHLSGVQRARVHLVLPSRTLFASSEQGASASVVLHMKPGFRMRDGQAKGIVHLVASSVRDLSPEHVTLVDGDGKRLGGSGAADGEQATESDGYRREIEQSKERAVQQILDTTLGVGKSVVRVAAQVNFAREEWTEERYDPQATATRSFQLLEEREGGPGKTVAGVPGTPSNLPGGDTATTGPAGSSGLGRRNETRNFEISKTLRRGVEPVGRVTGLQVAVVVDGKWTGKGDKRKFEPLPKAELDRIQAIAASAIGIDAKRGDKVLVECEPFEGIKPEGGAQADGDKPLAPYIRYGLIGAGALLGLVFLLGARSLFRSASAAVSVRALPATRAETLALELGQHQQQPQQQGSALPGPANDPRPPERTLAAAGPARDETIEQVRLLASELASQEPEAAARVIRGWLTEGRS